MISPRKAQAGFTLIELMIVVAIVAILAIVAVPNLFNAMKRSKKVEASLQLNAIDKSNKRQFVETSHYVIGTAKQLPTKGSPEGCCNGGGKDNHCLAVPADFAKDPVWKQLDFQIDEDSLFYYDYTGAGTGSDYTATATGDLDCDGTPIVYTGAGTSKDGNPAYKLTEPAPNSD